MTSTCHFTFWFCIIFVSILLKTTHAKCKLSDLQNVGNCTDAISREITSQTFLPTFSICEINQDGLSDHVFCSDQNQWKELEVNEHDWIKGKSRVKREGHRTLSCFLWGICPTLGDPNHGSVALTNSPARQGDFATYTCDHGYDRSHSESRRCLCDGGYDPSWTGSEPACVALDACISSPCVNAGVCENVPGSFTCRCTYEWAGETCEFYMNSCSSSPCANGGVCTNIEGSFTCDCTEGWAGPRCEHDFVLDLDNLVPDEELPLSSTVNVQLVYKEILGTGNILYKHPSLQFSCDFDERGSGYHYYVYWHISGRYVQTTGPSENKTDLVLTEDDIIGHGYGLGITTDLVLTEDDIIGHGYGLGITIQCQIRIKENPNGPVVSEDFFAGIKMHTETLEINKADLGTITFEPTVPIGCDHYDSQTISSDSQCNHEIQMIDVDKTEEYTCSESELAVENSHWCGLEIQGDTDGNWTARRYSMNVKATTVNYDDKNIFRVLLKMNHYGDNHEIWKNYQSPLVTVKVVDDKSWQYKVCKSVVDPHMTTFDGQAYENQAQGEWILYRNEQENIEVQEKTASCNANRAYCTCAVSVRDGGDVFTINLCGSAKVVDFVSCKDNILDVRELDNKLTYKVHTHIGTYIEIRLRPHPHHYYRNFMNVYVYTSPKDKGQSDGLCGFFDGNRNNDFVPRGKTSHVSSSTEFRTSWKITSSESLLTRKHAAEFAGEKSTFCVCEAIKNDDPPKELQQTVICSATDSQLCTANTNLVGTTKTCNVNRRKRSASSYREELWRRMALDDSNDLNIQKRSNDFEEDEPVIISPEALAACQEAIMNSNVATNSDNRIDQTSLNDTVYACAFDLTVTNMTSFIQTHKDSTNEVLKNYNHLDVNYTLSNPEKIAEFEAQSCPGNCSGHGLCTHGECICDDQYQGGDCSIDRAGPIDVTDIQFGGLCDRAVESECGNSINVQTFDLDENFKCKVQTTNTLADGTEISDMSQTNGDFHDIFNGACPTRSNAISPTYNVFITQYVVTVSNDGVHFGSGLTFHVYDSTCQNNNDGKFELKPGYCFINGHCFIGSTKNDACKQCVPEVNAYNWTEVCANDGGNNDASNTLLIVLAVICPVICLFIIIGLATCMKTYVFKSKRLVAVYNPPSHEDTVNSATKKGEFMQDTTIWRTELPNSGFNASQHMAI